MSGARWLLSGGLLGSGDTGRTVRDWVVDALVFAVAVAAGVYVLRSTWDQHGDAVKVLEQLASIDPAPDPTPHVAAIVCDRIPKSPNPDPALFGS